MFLVKQVNEEWKERKAELKWFDFLCQFFPQKINICQVKLDKNDTQGPQNILVNKSNKVWILIYQITIYPNRIEVLIRRQAMAALESHVLPLAVVEGFLVLIKPSDGGRESEDGWGKTVKTSSSWRAGVVVVVVVVGCWWGGSLVSDVASQGVDKWSNYIYVSV